MLQKLRHTSVQGLLVCLFLVACGSGDEPNNGGQSGEGENCTKTADCMTGLKCVGFVCVGKPVIPPDVGIPDRRLMSDTNLLPTKEGPVFMDGAMVFPAGNCADSSSEPNNSAGTATPLATKSSLVPGWEICYKFDVDQFAFKVKTGQKLTVKAKFSHSKGDLDMAMTEFGKVVSASRGDDNNEEVSWTATADGTFVVGVWGAAQMGPKSNPAINAYDLEVTVN